MNEWKSISFSEIRQKGEYSQTWEYGQKAELTEGFHHGVLKGMSACKLER